MLNSNICVDLHIHSKISEYKEDGNIVANSTFDNIDVLLTKLNDNKINLFAFADHNRFDKDLFTKTRDYINSKEAQKRYPNIKNILPVIEFDVKFEPDKEKCHVLTVFDYKNDEELRNIEEVINREKIEDKDGFYERHEFEKILRNIGLDVILIASQRKSLDNPTGGHNSLSDSVDDVYEFLKVAYISALEVQKSSIEGMLLNDLKDFPRRLSFTYGSDCHEWCYYPQHSKNNKMQDKQFYFKIKALTTFTGLVMAFTSPESRFGRKEVFNQKYIESLSLNDEKIELSFGINAIIGENGSGKSTIIYGLLNEANTGYAKRILNKNKFSVEPKDIDSSVYIYGIRQSQIIKNINDGFILGKENENVYFNEIKHDDFENKINNFAKDLFDNIENNITLEESRKKLFEKHFVFKFDIENKKTFYLQINTADFTLEKNEHKDKLIRINEIMETIKTEYKDNYYSDNQKEKIRVAFDALLYLRTSIIVNFKKKHGEISVKNLIINKAKNYSTSINTLISQEEKEINNYNEEKAKFKNSITDYVIKLNSINWKQIQMPDKFIGNGKTENPERGYIFIKRAKYATENLEDSFLKTIFNKDYADMEKLKKINEKKVFASAISGANIGNYSDVYNNKREKFIKAMKESQSYIQKADDNKKIGSTFGEQSLVVYDFLVHEDSKESILIIDQPEDNISNTKILSELVNKFSLLRDRKQIIVATHNPLLVVNLDVDNVIHLKNINETLKPTYGCLEDEGIISLIAETMDGGVDALERRYKVYGRS